MKIHQPNLKGFDESVSSLPERAGACDLIDLALAEDLRDGDITSKYFGGNAAQVRAVVLARESLIVAGVKTAAEVFRRVDPSIVLSREAEDGWRMVSGAVVLEVEGPAQSILAAERTALNFLQRLSGVATLTRAFVDAVEGTRARILDTRKTTPGFRMLEKAAVVAGGGVNHRFHLGDAILVKDNHFAALGMDGVRRALETAKRKEPEVPVILEADTLEQVRAFLTFPGVHRILLDNMPLHVLRDAVQMSAGRVPLEASGGVNLQTVRAIAETGVDFISVGCITHSARAVDLALDFVA